MNTTNVKAFKNLYVAEGGNMSDVENLTTTAEVVNAIAGFKAIADTGVQAEKGTVTLFGTKVSNMQTNVVVADGTVTGTLKFIQNGLAGSGPLAGDGNFLALKFIDNNTADSIKVGLVPSASNMDLVELDSDMNGVFKITGSLNQKLKVVTTKNGVSKTQSFDLSTLTLEEE